LLHEFAKETSDSSTSIFPTLEKVREISINVTALVTRFTLRKSANCSPTLYRARPYAYLLGNGGLTHAKLVSSDHLSGLGQTFLPSSLLKMF